MNLTGTRAPIFDLPTQFNTRFRPADYLGQYNVLILGYPLDWTPICSSELPVLNQLKERFEREADTLVVSLSADSVPSHLAWSQSMREPLRFPMMSDLHPHGAVSRALGLWIPEESITQRGTVLIDKNGVVRLHEIAGKANEGRRSIPKLLDAAIAVNGGAKPGYAPAPTEAPAAACPMPAGRPGGRPAGNVAAGGPVLYVRSGCIHCDMAKRALAASPAAQRVVRVVSTDAQEGLDEFKVRVAGPNRGLPTLVIPGQPVPLVGNPAVVNAINGMR